MNLKGRGMYCSWSNLREDGSIYQYLERLRKGTKRLSHDDRFPDRDLNTGPREYEAGVLPIRQQREISVAGC